MRQNFNSGQEIVYQDFIDIQSRGERLLLDRVIYELLQRKSDGFFQDSLSAVFQNSTSVLIKSGLGYITEDTGSKEPIRKPLYLATDQTVNLDTPDVSNPRVDIVCVKWKRSDVESENRKYKDEFTDNITTQSFVVATDWDVEVNYIAGTPAGSPVAPAVPAGYIKVCEMAVAASVGMSDQTSVTDSRSLLPLLGSASVTGSNEYDKVVGDTALVGVTHSSLKLALDNASDGEKILVLADETIDTIPVVLNNNIEIVFKRGVTLSRGTTTSGLQIDGNDCKLVNARFSGFSTVGDKAVIVSSGALRTYLDAPRFLNCDTNIDDQGTETFIPVSYSE
jgi:hypothetical protein